MCPNYRKAMTSKSKVFFMAGAVYLHISVLPGVRVSCSTDPSGEKISRLHGRKTGGKNGGAEQIWFLGGFSLLLNPYLAAGQ